MRITNDIFLKSLNINNNTGNIREKSNTDYSERAAAKKNQLPFFSIYKNKNNQIFPNTSYISFGRKTNQKMIYNFERNRTRAEELSDYGIFEYCIEELSNLKKKNYNKAIKLAQIGLQDETILDIVKSDKRLFKRALNLQKNGVYAELIRDFLTLSEENYKEAIKLMKQGYSPSTAQYLAEIESEKREEFLKLINNNIDKELAKSIILLNENEKNKFENYLSQGISAAGAIELVNLNENQQKRVQELIHFKIGDENIADYAELSEEEYHKALNLLSDGIFPEFIIPILRIESGKSENDEYKEYIKRGYSKSSSFALSLLNEEEGETLKNLIKINPEIKDILKENYDINLISRQNSDVSEIILDREIINADGNKIILIQIFDTNGNHTKSRLEEYKDHSTSSVINTGNNIYHARYDKYGEIKEFVQIISDEKSNNVTGVIHAKASDKLKGAFERTYYDINQFKTDQSNYFDNNSEFDTEKCVISKGKPISSITENPDGSITYNEEFEKNNTITRRIYTEKRNSSNQKQYSYYKYEIKDKKGKTLSDTEREIIQTAEGKYINKINGITYNVSFDDTHKTIRVSDGKRTKILNFGTKLSYYSKDILWEQVKKLPIDTLYTLYNNIDRWDYCDNSEAAADGRTKTIHSGTQPDITTHECGHIKIYNYESILENEELIKIYNEEMNIFEKNTPWNEQEFIQYFSPKADLCDSEGLEEFIAETNIILSSYGINYNELNTRSQMLIWNFPNTIAKIAELLGNNSQKSILE